MTNLAICPHCDKPNEFSCFMGRPMDTTGRTRCDGCGQKYRWHRKTTVTVEYTTEKMETKKS